jgi:hypothetical protein
MFRSIILCLSILVAISCKKEKTYSGNSTLFVKASSNGFIKSQDATSESITPSIYNLALVNFWLIDKDGGTIDILNEDENNPSYTIENPKILSFNDNSLIDLISERSIPSNEYTGYKMEFLYIEMELPVSFHSPYDPSVETEIDNPQNYFDQELTKTFRLYFNSIGDYCKRDFVVQLEDNSDIWYWLRREVSNNAQKFFIKNNPEIEGEHPPGGPGPESIIDLFSDEQFWGRDDALCTPNLPIIVGTHTSAGGIDCRLEGSLIIDEASEELRLMIDVTNTMLYEEAENADAILLNDVLDLGPGTFEGGVYGDFGLHPTLPRFEVIEE